MSGDRMRWFRAYLGRNWARASGDVWCLSLDFIIRRDLMTREDWGRMVLTGLHFEVEFRIRGAHSLWSPFNAPLIRVWFRSDAAEIATRIARLAGQ